MAIGCLLIYNLIFFKKFYENPYKMCASELASTFFPFWRWAKGRIIFKSNMYYPYPACIPFLSNFYPWHILSSYIASFLKSIDNQFKLFSLGILAHYILGSFLAYFVFFKYGILIALFGAISLTYSAYFIKIFTPCAAYSMAWMPGILLGGWKGSFCLGMAILGGYWPIAIFSAILLCFAPSSGWGILIGLPQIIPFLWYYPRSVRWKQKFDKNIGKVPLWRYLDLILPNQKQNTINGIFWPEMTIYTGFIPLITLTALALTKRWVSGWTITLLLSLILKIQRIPARSLYLFSFSLVQIATVALGASRLGSNTLLALLCLQAYLLLQNADIYPHFPFCQWWDKPSEIYQKYAKEKWPNFTGYLEGKHISDYKGAFALK